MTDADFAAGLHCDPSLLRHFEAPAGANLSDALTHAIRLYGRIRVTATWFWFNGTPAPIQPDDTPDTLGHRYSVWRAAYQQGQLLQIITTYIRSPP